MPDSVGAQTVRLSINPKSTSLINDLQMQVYEHLSPDRFPIRFAVTNSQYGHWHCELGISFGSDLTDSIFTFHQRQYEDTNSFNVVMLIPTGIGSSIGGHAGDATPAAAILSTVCDTLITHPNVLNASDIIQIPTNTLYVEGSLVSQLMMGNIGLRRVRSNRILVLVQSHDDDYFTTAAINSVNAARASYGLDASIVELDNRFRMTSEYAPDGHASGQIEGMDYIYSILDERLGDYDAVAVTSVVDVPIDLQELYYRGGRDIVNPWGGVEALLTHSISLRYGIPSAHAPMLESRSVSEADFGIVDPRMAAEVISLAFLQCVLRGLQRSPAVVPVSKDPRGVHLQSTNVSCLVIPDGCIGLPTLAALINEVPVIAVKGNTNRMRNNLESLPWKGSRFFRVENYLEAAGVIAALRAGIAPWSVLRPVAPIAIHQPVDTQHTALAVPHDRTASHQEIHDDHPH